MNKVTCMIRILHPKIYANLLITKMTLNQWKQTHSPQSATAINSLMAQGLASFLGRIGEQYAAAALIIQQAAFLRPCEVLNVTKADFRLPESIVLEGTPQRVASVVIRNAKTAKKGKPQVAIIDNEIVVKTLEILMDYIKNLPKTENIFANIIYSHYSKQLQLAARYFDLDHIMVTPHGARLGRAFEDFNNRVTLEDIAVGGRLSTLDSAVSYIKNGQASLINEDMGPYSESELRIEAGSFRDMIRGSWEALRRKTDPEVDPVVIRIAN